MISYAVFIPPVYEVYRGYIVFAFSVTTRVIFYVRRMGLYLYKYRIYGTITIHILKGLAPVYHLI